MSELIDNSDAYHEINTTLSIDQFLNFNDTYFLLSNIHLQRSKMEQILYHITGLQRLFPNPL